MGILILLVNFSSSGVGSDLEQFASGLGRLVDLLLDRGITGAMDPEDSLLGSPQTT